MSRTRITSIASIALALFLAACGEGSLVSPHENVHGPDLNLLLSARGFDTSKVLSLGDHVIVEGDIQIAKADLLAAPKRSGDGLRAPRTPAFQWATNSAVTYTAYTKVVVVDISALAAEPGWQSAASQAMTNWNNVYGMDLIFQQGTPGDITMSFGSCSGCIAVSSWPSNGNVGPTITIDRTYDYYSVPQKAFVLTHELGHNVGLGHTDLTSGSGQFYHIFGTPNSDPASIMNSVYGGQSFTDFTNGDKLAAMHLFPEPVRNIQVSYPSGNVTVDWDTVGGATSYRVTHSYYLPSEDQAGNPYMEQFFEDYTTSSHPFIVPSDRYTGNTDCLSQYRVTAIFPWGESTFSVEAPEAADCT